MTTATTRRQEFLENAQRLVSILGDWIHPSTPHLLKRAEHLVQRKPYPSRAKETGVQVELDKLDWTGRSTNDPSWQLTVPMRFGLLTPLAIAFRQTGGERYAQSARAYMEAYLRAYPVTDGWAPCQDDHATCYPYRIGNTFHGGWLGTLSVFLASQTFDDDFFELIVSVTRVWLSYLADHVYPGRNIRILHGSVLLLNGLRLTFLPESARWRSLGVRILNDAMARQLLPDGADMEGSPEYHCDVLNVLVVIAKLAQGYPELGLRVPREKLAAMYDYAMAVTRPDGALTSLNDSTYSPPQGRFGDGMVRARSEYLQTVGLPDQMPPACRHYVDVGQVFLRDHWGPDATYITFDATIRRGWHWHPSRNAIQIFAHRRALLVDPGYPLKYALHAPCYGENTAHHNTINIDSLDQSHSLAWARLRQAPGYDLVEGLYNGGYWPTENNRHGQGVFGEHHRSLLWIRGRCVVVLDQLSTMPQPRAEHQIESIWQLSEGDVRLNDDGRSAVTAHSDSNLLLLFPLMCDGMNVSIHKGEHEPMRGWVPASAYTHYLPAPMVRLHVRKREPWKVHLATVLIPFEGTHAPQVQAQSLPPGSEFTDRTAGQLDLRWHDGSRDLVVWTGRLEEAIDQQHGLDTDSSLVHLQFDREGTCVQGLMVDGSFLHGNAAGGDLISHVRQL